MPEQTRRSLALIFGSIIIGSLVSWAGGHGSARFGPISVFALCGLIAFGLNWLVFIPSNLAKTERYFDLTGSLTYLAIILFAVSLSPDLDTRAALAAAMVAIWAVRLGSFLFLRIRRQGRDGRFDTIKTDPLRFFATWTVQGLWVLLTAAAALAIVTTDQRQELGWIGYTGVFVWLAGFSIEVVADRQKSVFRREPANGGRFISSGLWAWSRHPNYFGEITLWTGIAIMSLPVLSGWQWVVLVSPVFVTLLLTRLSGVPMLEARADRRWGDDEAYQRYKTATPVLIPRPPRS